MSLTFDSFGFSKPILKAISDLGFLQPTEIQLETYAVLLDQDTDFLGLAQTGTGKTAAFGLPLLERIDPTNDQVQAVILSPTRELCQQIAEQLTVFSKYMHGVRVLPIFGGASIRGQMDGLKQKPQIIVATPGRLIDFLGRKKINLEELKLLVLDEADEMLKMGFKEDMDEILRFTNQDKLTWLFSATMPPFIKKVVSEYMHQPVEVEVRRVHKTNQNIEHLYAQVKKTHKLQALKRIIDVHPDSYGIIFCNTRIDTVEVADALTKSGYAVDLLNGDLSQAQRDHVMARFKTRRLQMLVATDVASRGLDVNDLTHVIHYSLPDKLEDYTHRSGRTARAGKSGISLSLLSGRDEHRRQRLEKMLQISMEQYQIPLLKDVQRLRMQNWLTSLAEVDDSKLDLTEDVENWLELFTAKVPKMTLIKKMLVHSLGDLAIEGQEQADLNVDHKSERKSRRDRNDRGDRNDRSSKEFSSRSRRDRRDSHRASGNFVTFMLNVGENVIDNKGHLLRLLCDETGLSKPHFGDIWLDRSTSRIDVESDFAAQFQHQFEGTKLKGEKITVTLTKSKKPRAAAFEKKSVNKGGRKFKKRFN